MTVASPRPAPRAVLLPGAGSDAEFVERAFAAALSGNGVELVAVEPEPHALISGYRAALEEAARAPGVLLVGGISLGAAVAAQWALLHQRRLSGLLIALPAWLGAPDDAPASLSARHSAAQLRLLGLPAVLGDVRSTTPPWLGAELSRAWTRLWPELPRALEDAATQQGPTEAELGRLTLPTGVVGAVGDALHPLAVAQAWATASPNAALGTVGLAEFGADPAVLGAACLEGWTAARRHAALLA